MFPLQAAPEVTKTLGVSCWFVSVFLWRCGCELMCLCLGDIIREDGCLRGRTLATTTTNVGAHF